MTIKTSDSSPIRVDFLPVHAVGLPGRIGMTFAPGKNAAGISGRWERDLETDLGRLCEVYGTCVLVDLLETQEVHALRIDELVEGARSRGLEVVEFPIADGGVPASHEVLAACVRTILAASAEGRNVTVHCRGGLGRSGLVATACLLDRGMGLELALRTVRTARAGTVETAGQERFLKEHERWLQKRRAPRVELRPELVDGPGLSRFRGCLLGGALGDALGYPIEFTQSSKLVLQKFGPFVPDSLAYASAAPAVISDDTQMTLFTAEGIIRSEQRYRNRGISSTTGMIRLALRRWYATQVRDERAEPMESPGWLFGERRLHVARAPGNTNLRALDFKHSSELPTIEAPPNDSKGCGAIMRSAPIGLAALTRELAFEVGRDAAVVTHGHPSGYLSAAYFAAVIHDLARGATLEGAMTNADQLLKQEVGAEETARAIAGARALAALGIPTPEALETLGGGWVAEEALAIALACALTAEGRTSEGFAAALWRSVVHAGDSDSTGSLTGNLLGALHGDSVLPTRWLAELELLDVIDRVACDLHAIAIWRTELDYDSYPPN